MAIKWVALATLLVTAGAGVPAAELAPGGPYVIQVGPTSATVVWLVPAGDRLRAQKITLSGLQPGQSLDYRVGDGGEQRGRFKTPPADATPFQFVVYGDTRSRPQVHARAVAAIAAHRPDFLIHTGDLVADGGSVSQWSEFFIIERELLQSAAFFPAIGNHEKSDPQFQEFFGAGRSRYSFWWGSAFFAVLNSDLDTAGQEGQARETFWIDQLAWLDQELARNPSAAFRFVVVHQPPITAMTRRRESADRLAVGLIPILEERGVTALFAGHDHSYQRHEKAGVQYIVTAGAGAPLYDIDAPIPGITQKAEKTENFVVVRVEGKQARVEAMDLDGRRIDAVTMKAAKALGAEP